MHERKTIGQSAHALLAAAVANRYRHMAWEKGFIEKYGRKFTLALIVVFVGMIVHLLGIFAIIRVPSVETAREITEVVKAFREVLIVAIFCFTGADMLITKATASLDPAKAGPGPNRPSGTVTATEG